MTKDEFLTHLRSLGYEADYEDGSIVITAPDGSVFKEIREIAKSVGYDKSYGWRNHK